MSLHILKSIWSTFWQYVTKEIRGHRNYSGNEVLVKRIGETSPILILSNHYFPDKGT